MKQNSILSGIAAFGLICLAAPIALGQQAPSYSYQQPRYAPPRYYVPPGNSMPQQQQGYAQPSQIQYVSPAKFLPTFGRKVGSLFRKLFYGPLPPLAYGDRKSVV